MNEEMNQCSPCVLDDESIFFEFGKSQNELDRALILIDCLSERLEAVMLPDHPNIPAGDLNKEKERESSQVSECFKKNARAAGKIIERIQRIDSRLDLPKDVK